MHFVGESVALIIYFVFVNGDNAMEVSSEFWPVAPLLCLASVAMAIEVEYNTYFWAFMQFCTGLHMYRQTWPWWVWRHWFSEFCDILEWTLTPDSAGWIQMTCNLTISGKNGSIILSCHQHQPRQKGMGVPVLVYWSLFAPAFY